MDMASFGLGLYCVGWRSWRFLFAYFAYYPFLHTLSGILAILWQGGQFLFVDWRGGVQW